MPALHTPKRAHSERNAQVVMARMKRMLFPSLRMFVPDSARVGMLPDGFLPRGARKISHMKGLLVRREMPKTHNTHPLANRPAQTPIQVHAPTHFKVSESV